MMRPSLWPRLLLLGLLATGGAASCGDDDDNNHHDAGMNACDQESRAESYVAGIEKKTGGSSFTVRIVEATPTPPDRGDNTWVLQVLGPTGMATDTASVTARPKMPDHGHGTTPPEHTAVARGSEGKYDLGPMNMFMSGFWQIPINVASAGLTETATFAFCLEG